MRQLTDAGSSIPRWHRGRKREDGTRYIVVNRVLLLLQLHLRRLRGERHHERTDREDTARHLPQGRAQGERRELEHVAVHDTILENARQRRPRQRRPRRLVEGGSGGEEPAAENGTQEATLAGRQQRGQSASGEAPQLEEYQREEGRGPEEPR